MNKNIPSFFLVSGMMLYSLYAFFKNLDQPDNWRFYAALGGLLVFSFFMGLLVKSSGKKVN
jgi:drug/metabolite transporter superfamily protein YnfA